MRSPKTIRAVVVVAVLGLVGVFAAPSQAVVTVINGRGTNDTLFGTRGRDVMNGKAGADAIMGRLGNDILKLGPGTSTDPANPTARQAGFPGAGYDAVIGGNDTDIIVSDDGDNPVDLTNTRFDSLNGGAGGDFLVAADGGRDQVNCGADPANPANPDPDLDVLIVDPSDTLVNCGFDAVFDAETDDIGAGPGQVPVGVGAFATLHLGTIAGETIDESAQATAQIIAGKGGEDTLLGGTGDDQIGGGPGADVIQGGDGKDQVADTDGTTGDYVNTGAGADTVVTADGAPDMVDCGTGGEVFAPTPDPTTFDIAIVDKFDVVIHCEIVRKK